MLSSFIAVDTETTGLDFERDRMIELAAVRFEDGKPVAEFEALLSPGDRALSPVSRLITGLDPERLRDAPPASETLRAFTAFVGNLPLVAHNAEFDAHFVRRSMEAEGLAPLPGAWLDSLPMSRAAWPDWENHKLDTLARKLDLARDGEHRALPDARRAGFVFLEALRRVRANASPETWRDLSRLTADLPGWNLVFNENDAPNRSDIFFGEGTRGDDLSPSPGNSGTAPNGPSGAVRARAEALDEAAREAIEEALADEAAVVLETPAGADEHAAALRAALAALNVPGSAPGRRVLLAVPDSGTANALWRAYSAPEGSATSATAGDGTFALLGLPADYPDRKRLAALAENPARATEEERAAIWPLLAAAGRSPAAPLPVWAGRAFSPDRSRLAWARVRAQGWADDAAARAARAAAEHAQATIVTHAALCAHLALDGALLPACDALVVTGAHRLPDAMLESAGRRISLFRLRDILHLVRAAASPGSDEGAAGAWADIAPTLVALSAEEREAWKERWFAPDRELQKFLQKAGRRAEKLRQPGDFRVRYAEHAALAFGADPAPVLDALRANEALLETVASNPDQKAAGEAHRVLSHLREFRKDFEFLSAAHDPEWIHWFEEVANPHKAALRAIPRDPGRAGIAAAIENLFAARVFLSPALFSTSGAGEETKGGDRARAARDFLLGAGMPAPDDDVDPPVRARCVADDAGAARPRFVLAPSAPQTGSPEQTEAFARFLAEAAGPLSARGVLVFCPSQAQVRALHAALRAALPPETPLWAQHIDGNRDALARLYASERGGWTLATEGMTGLRDLDGSVPSLWIVSRMPFPPPRDPVLEARGEMLRNGREPWRAAAILRVKREWHALRRGTAPGTVWLTDARAAGDGLGTRLARAMGWEALTAKNGEALRAMTASMDNG